MTIIFNDYFYSILFRQIYVFNKLIHQTTYLFMTVELKTIYFRLIK